MKVYTEVNYIWKDDKLVQTDSKSYEYEGEVEQCHKKWYSHPHITIPTINEIKETVSKGPTGGTAKDIADAVYGGSTKDAVESVQQTYKDAESGVRNVKDQIVEQLFPTGTTPDLEEDNDDDDDTKKTFMSSQGRSSATDIGGGRTKERVLESSRTQANLTGKRRSSLLTARR